QSAGHDRGGFAGRPKPDRAGQGGVSADLSRITETRPMIDERYREDRERRRLGSLTVFSGPTHSGKTKKLEAEAERAQCQGRRMQRLAHPADANQLVDQLDPATELVTVDDAQQYDDRLVEVLNDLATIHTL